MKIVSVVFVVLASLSLLGCPEDKPSSGAPTSTAGATKAAASAAPTASGGW